MELKKKSLFELSGFALLRERSNGTRRFTKPNDRLEVQRLVICKQYHRISAMHTAVGERGCAYQLHSYHHLDKSINKWVKKQEVLDLYEEGCSDSVDRAEQVGRRTELCYCKSDLCNSGVLIELHNIIHALVVMRILSII